MLIALTMPQFGESITQARIVRWLKSEGDDVSEGEPLVEMETEKSVFSYESPFKGKLTKIIAKDEIELPVGEDIAQFEIAEGDAKRYLALGIGHTIGKIGEKIPEAQPSPQKSESASESVSKLSPLIRSLAKENNISVEEAEKIPTKISGGHITKEDFLSYIGKPAPTKTSTTREGVQIIPLTPVRARIADNMMLSKQKIPHASCSVDVDFFNIDKWRSEQKEKAPGYFAFTVMAVLKVLKNHPVMNSSLKDADGKRWIEQYDYINLGIAVAAEQGLMVPVIKNAQKFSFKELNNEMQRLIEGTRKGTLKPDELTGGTFTINNTGAVGAVRTSQIIPYPQAAILAVNRLVRRPWAVGDNIGIRPIMALDIAFDHRIIDGEQGGKFLVDVAKELENFNGSLIS